MFDTRRHADQPLPDTTKASSVGLPIELLRWESYSQMAGRLASYKGA
jgi:hypothetical protein